MVLWKYESSAGWRYGVTPSIRRSIPGPSANWSIWRGRPDEFCHIIQVSRMLRMSVNRLRWSIQLGTASVYSVKTHSARNLGFIFDEHLTFSNQISSVSKSCYTISVSFAVSVHTSVPKQPPPSPLPLFTPSSTTATLFITTCPSVRSPGSNRSRTLLHVLLSKLPNSVTPLPSSGLYTG